MDIDKTNGEPFKSCETFIFEVNNYIKKTYKLIPSSIESMLNKGLRLLYKRRDNSILVLSYYRGFEFKTFEGYLLINGKKEFLFKDTPGNWSNMDKTIKYHLKHLKNYKPKKEIKKSISQDSFFSNTVWN